MTGTSPGAGLYPGTPDGMTTSRPVSGTPDLPAAEPTGLLPPVHREPGDSGHYGNEAQDRGARQDGVYRTRRPAQAIIIAVVMAVLAVPAVRLFLSAAFADVPVAREIVPASLLVLGIPLLGAGLYALIGSGRAGGWSAWLRPPVGYLTVALALLLAAAVAVG
jgi:hypothetical protein